jgi:iron complex outermembrane recepter protein
MKMLKRTTILARSLTLAFISGGAVAQEALPDIDVGQTQPFQLGQSAVGEQKGSVTLRPDENKNADNGPAPRQKTDNYGGVSISNRQTETFATETLDQAVNLAAGVNSNTTGTSRNEQNIYVRGFDRWQVPITVDGIRVYLPQDNRLDFARFDTPNIAAIEISKGYVSVLDGPGAMGGLINIVTRKPTKELDIDARSRLDFGRDGTYEGVMNSAYVGTKQQGYYAQLSGLWRDEKGWMLPDSFQSTNVQGWGFRNQTGTYDWNLSARVALTPNATDEYSLTFNHQEGKKGAPLNVVDPLSAQRYWTWPFWNTQSLYFLSNTKVGDASYVKLKGYWNTFDNSLDSYSNIYMNLQNTPAAFNSVYNDYALGTAIEAGTEIAGVDTLKTSLEYRLDGHHPSQQYFAFKGVSGCIPNVVCYTQPTTTSLEDVYSIALENTYHPIPQIDLVQGFSYDWRHLRQAQDFNSNLPTKTSPYPFGVVNYPVNDGTAPNFQGAAVYRYSDTDNVHFNVSDRERFPTLFERFSTQFGGATSNPSLAPERAINFDLGWASNFAPRSKITVDVYYDIIRNLIQSVPVPQYGAGVTQSQNVGDGQYFGGEITADYAVRDDLSIGGNLSVEHRHVVAPYILNFQPIGVPDLKILAFVGYRPIEGLTLTPSIEYNGSRWSVTDIGLPYYYRTGAFVKVNANVEYQVNKNLKISAGVRNLFDTGYTFTWGYPEPGRSLYLGVKATF